MNDLDQDGNLSQKADGTTSTTTKSQIVDQAVVLSQSQNPPVGVEEVNSMPPAQAPQVNAPDLQTAPVNTMPDSDVGGQIIDANPAVLQSTNATPSPSENNPSGTVIPQNQAPADPSSASVSTQSVIPPVVPVTPLNFTNQPTPPIVPTPQPSPNTDTSASSIYPSVTSGVGEAKILSQSTLSSADMGSFGTDDKKKTSVFAVIMAIILFIIVISGLLIFATEKKAINLGLQNYYTKIGIDKLWGGSALK